MAGNRNFYCIFEEQTSCKRTFNQTYLQYIRIQINKNDQILILPSNDGERRTAATLIYYDLNTSFWNQIHMCLLILSRNRAFSSHDNDSFYFRMYLLSTEGHGMEYALFL